MAVHVQSLFQRARAEWRDSLLTALTLAIVVHLFVVTPLALHPGLLFKALNIGLAMALAAGLLILARGWVLATLLLLFLGLFGLSYLVQGNGGGDMTVVRIRSSAWLLMGLAIAWSVIRAVYAPGPITYHRVVGAMLLYICVGIIFAALYAIVASQTTNALSGYTITPHNSLPAEVVYFSFVTLTTVGYGDFSPVDPLVRGLSNLEAIIGQLYPATLLARLVASEARIGGTESP